MIVSGQGAYESPSSSQAFADLLGSREIPHTLDFWGHDVNHDWPWWRRMLPHYLARVC